MEVTVEVEGLVVDKELDEVGAVEAGDELEAVDEIDAVIGVEAMDEAGEGTEVAEAMDSVVGAETDEEGDVEGVDVIVVVEEAEEAKAGGIGEAVNSAGAVVDERIDAVVRVGVVERVHESGEIEVDDETVVTDEVGVVDEDDEVVENNVVVGDDDEGEEEAAEESECAVEADDFGTLQKVKEKLL